MKNLLSILLVVLSLNSFSQQKAPEWHTNVNKAINISTQTEKPLFLFFTGSDWCGWCKKLVAEVFEKPEFAQGTLQLGLAIAKHTDQGNCFSMAGGGDTLAAVHLFKIQDSLSALSTAGGAFLECIEGKELPSITALTQHSP